MAEKSPRMAVVQLLAKLENHAFSNLALDGVLSKSDYTSQEKSFISRIFYGVIERKLTLDHIISLYSKKPLQKLDTDILIALRCGIYQLLYMDSVPDNAAVNESVDLVKQLGKKSAAGFVNAVLRNFIRDDKKFPLPKDEISALSVKYSCPKELLERLMGQYEKQNVEKFLDSALKPHKLYLRVNNTKIGAEKLIDIFDKNGIKAHISEFDGNCIEAEPFGSVENTEMFLQGFYHVQDLSSQLCCKALSVKENDTVLDICAAPGGKSFTLAESAGDNCKIYSCDLHKKRTDLIKSGAKRLGLESIEPLQNDAKVFNENFPKFDKILCDVPCSGFGVIRSKPEIKYNELKNVADLPQIQYDILCTASRYLKVGGELVYSTCTVLKEENDLVIDKFLENYLDFEGVSFLTELGEPFGGFKASIIGGNIDCEGFFISKIRRVK